MISGDAVVNNLLSAPVLAFVVALVATWLKSDLRLPGNLYAVLSTYLLLAIGLKGGRGLAAAGLAELWRPLLASLALGVVTPLVAYVALRRLGGLGVIDASAVAAHYGSVSAVTFTVVLAFLEATAEPFEGYLAGLLAVLEVIGIVVALALAQRHLSQRPLPAVVGAPAADVPGGGDPGAGDGDAIAGAADSANEPGGSAGGGPWREALAEVVRGRSVALLLGGLVIGLAAGPERLEPVDPLFVGLFQGALTLFLLEMGVVAGQRLRDVQEVGVRLIGLGIAIPVVNGFLGALAGRAAGLSVGGITVLATLAASASYIAAPAAVRIALPSARPGLYITASLGITFPFNIVIGIPLYYAMARGLT